MLILFARRVPWLLMGEQKSSLLLHIQTDRQVILDPEWTNWPVSPTQVNQASEGGGRETDREEINTQQDQRERTTEIREGCIKRKTLKTGHTERKLIKKTVIKWCKEPVSPSSHWWSMFPCPHSWFNCRGRSEIRAAVQLKASIKLKEQEIKEMREKKADRGKERTEKHTH